MSSSMQMPMGPRTGSGQSAKAANSAEMAQFGLKLAEVFRSRDGKEGVSGIEERRVDVMRALEKKNYRDALRHLNRWEQDLNRAVRGIRKEGQPGEISELARSINKAKRYIELGVPGSAIRAIDDAGVIVENLQKQIGTNANSQK